MPASEPGDPNGIVVLRLSSVGDIVLTEPVVAVLRETFPRSRIGFVVKERYGDLISAHPAIDRVHLLSGSAAADMRRLAREVRQAGYGAAVDLHCNFRTAGLLRASRIPLVTS
ncbi:MAG: hypothetical protein JXB46_07085, partial [Candidatus Eisenbacteria bacterium]|nr:hypothetical protein [Candidatus Eisenbacteria bacterium]